MEMSTFASGYKRLYVTDEEGLACVPRRKRSQPRWRNRDR